VLNDGSVACWGANTGARQGPDGGMAANSVTPVAVPDVSSAQAIAAGGFSTCTESASGEVQCWGDNAYSPFGDGSWSTFAHPVVVASLSGAKYLSLGGGPAARIASNAVECVGANCDDFGCAVLRDGTVDCWGSNTYGQLGDGTLQNAPGPVAVTGLRNVLAVAAGVDHTCALLAGGTVSCWGDNAFGAVGTGAADMCGGYSCALTPVQVPGLTGVVAIAAGEWFSCAEFSSGAVECWGINQSGELGRSTTRFYDATPAPVVGL
jgi:alpha-tubulin suppressor-like RCC1 family protein